MSAKRRRGRLTSTFQLRVCSAATRQSELNCRRRSRSKKHRVYRDRGCITALEAFLDGAVRSGGVQARSRRQGMKQLRTLQDFVQSVRPKVPNGSDLLSRYRFRRRHGYQAKSLGRRRRGAPDKAHRFCRASQRDRQPCGRGWSRGPLRVKNGKAQREQMFSAVHPTTDMAKIFGMSV